MRTLIEDGQIQERVLRATHVSQDELLSCVRQYGRTSLDEVKHAFLEQSGQITIVFRDRS